MDKRQYLRIAFIVPCDPAYRADYSRLHVIRALRIEGRSTTA
jgi:hypothetical protein